MASIFESIFGGVPKIADYTDLDYGTEQNLALESDLAAFPQISALGADYQKSYLDELNTAIPGFSDILAEGGTLTKQMEGIAGTELSGQLPADVAAQVQRTSAFQNLLSGGGGSMADANTARNYGLTSLDLINQGANMAGQAGNAAQRWAAATGAGASANVMAGMLQTPQQRAAFDTDQAKIQYAIQQAKNNAAAAPNPALQALNQWIEQVGGTAIGALVGAKPGQNYKTSYDPTSSGAPQTNFLDNVTQGTGGGSGGGGAIVADPNAGGATYDPNAAGGSIINMLTGYNSSANVPGYYPTEQMPGLYNPTDLTGTSSTDSFLASLFTNNTGSTDFNVPGGYGQYPAGSSLFSTAAMPSPGATPIGAPWAPGINYGGM